MEVGKGCTFYCHISLVLGFTKSLAIRREPRGINYIYKRRYVTAATCAYSYCLREAASWALLRVMLSGTVIVTVVVSTSKLTSMVSAHAVSAVS